MKTFLAVLLFLGALGFGFFFVATTFQHGLNSGLIRLQRMEGAGPVYGVGTIVCLLGAIASLRSGKKD